ncbi:hypothetical protein NXW24_20810 [Bacteroides fragilis]|nr:hypothetical protein [Bacteroides fragilis]
MTRYSDDYWKEHMNNGTIMTPDGDTELTMKWSSRMRHRNRATPNSY